MRPLEDTSHTSCLKLVNGFEGIHTWDVSVLEAKKKIAIVIFGISQILTHQEKIWPKGPDNLIPGLGHDNAHHKTLQ